MWWLIIMVLVLIVVLLNVRIVPQANAFVIERLGKYKGVWESGLHVKLPFADKIVKKVCLKEQVMDFEPQPVITKDNVTMHIDSVLFFTIRDPKLYVYGVDRPLTAIENLTATTMRNIVGDLELDECLTSRDVINSKITELIDIASDPWGIKVNRVEVKNIIPPEEIQTAMEKQMKAEREKREQILRAEGEKEALVIQAEAEKTARILAAEAAKEEKKRLAEGEAEAILKVKQATADGIKQINESKPSREYLNLRAMEAFEKASDGKATKIIVPSNIQGIAGLTSAIVEVAKGKSPNNQKGGDA